MTIPCHPCGRVVDYIRDPYRAQMRPWNDLPDTIEVRWFRADLENGFIGGPSPYRSSYWYDPNDNVPDGAGEIPPRTYGRDGGEDRIGFRPGPLCGDQSIWERGGNWDDDPHLETDEDGVAPCCRVVTMRASGGQQQGTVRFAVMDATGGQQQYGYAAMGVLHPILATGGQRQGGTAAVHVRALFAAAGGQRQGGAAAVRVRTILTATGGQGQGGEAAILAPGKLFAAGGQRQGGAAAVRAPARMTGSGGQDQGGAAAFRAPARMTGSGGQDQGGAAAFRAPARMTGSGGQDQGGTAVQFPIPVGPSVRSTLVRAPAPNDFNVGKPSGTLNGDLIVVAMCAKNTPLGFLPGLAGFALNTVQAFGTSHALVLFTKVAASEPSSWATSGLTGCTTSVVAMAVKDTSGLDIVGAGASGSTTTITLTGITAGAAHTLLLAGLGSDGTGSPSPTSGMVTVAPSGMTDPITVTYRKLVAAGATGNQTFLSGSGLHWGGVLLAAKP